jgi:AraC-like DNA-binding protein
MVSHLRGRELLEPPVPVDPRVVTALDALPQVERIQQLAERVGLSPSWLRTLVRDHTGTSLVRLRMWQRLRRSLHSLRDRPIAEAAVDAGFADQPHLTRTARDLIGHTPSTLLMQLR